MTFKYEPLFLNSKLKDKKNKTQNKKVERIFTKIISTSFGEEHTFRDTLFILGSSRCWLKYFLVILWNMTPTASDHLNVLVDVFFGLSQNVAQIIESNVVILVV